MLTNVLCFLTAPPDLFQLQIGVIQGRQQLTLFDDIAGPDMYLVYVAVQCSYHHTLYRAFKCGIRRYAKITLGEGQECNQG